MRKKLLIFILSLAALACIFALSVSAANMTNYCTVELTLTSGETVTAYCSTTGNQMQRDNLYKTPDSEGEKYSWEDVVIFDCRNQTVVGNNFPRAFAGTGCNSSAKNVTTVYLSEYFTYFLNTTFTSGWTSLDTVYISSTVTEIKGFGGSPVKNVVFAQGSQLTSVGNDAFSGCISLEYINLEECKSIKSIAGNAFRQCTNLKSITLNEGLESIGRNGFYLAGLEGTIVVPNSVTYLDAGAFLSTKIETLVLGDGIVSIDYNFLGMLSSKNDQWLKNVYISAETTFKSNNIFFKSANPVNFYIVGEDCDSVKNALLSQSVDLNNNYMTFILAEDATDETGAGYGIIHVGYNRCDAFYGGEHLFDSQSALESCIVECDRCGKTVFSGGEHSYELVEEFAGDKFLTSGSVKNVCSVCNDVESEVFVGAIVKWMGYSVPEYDTNGEVAMAQWFCVDEKELLAYTEATGKSAQYGIVAALGTKVNPISVENGVVTAIEGAIMYNLTGVNSIQVKISGITQDKYDEFLVFSGYIVDGDEVNYINNGGVTPSAVAVSYNQLLNLNNGIVE